ncbi:hypothetical protein [Pontibacter litorisediminis]|nr:hypothetical protein [Pontibacter litorisediminis]
MRLVKFCQGDECKTSLPVVAAAAFILFMYFAGEAAGEFLYYISH